MGTIPDQLQPKASLAINSTATFAARNKDTEIRIVVERMVWPLGSRMLSGDDISKIQSPKRDPDHLPNERNFHVPKTLSSVRSNQLIRLKNQNADFLKVFDFLKRSDPQQKGCIPNAIPAWSYSTFSGHAPSGRDVNHEPPAVSQSWCPMNCLQHPVVVPRIKGSHPRWLSIYPAYALRQFHWGGNFESHFDPPIINLRL